MLVLVALPAGVALFGFLGLLALLPITVFGRAVARSVVAALDMAPRVAADALADRAAASVDPGAEPALDDPLGAAAPDSEIPRWLDRLGQWSWRGLVLAALAGLVIGLVRHPDAAIARGLGMNRNIAGVVERAASIGFFGDADEIEDRQCSAIAAHAAFDPLDENPRRADTIAAHLRSSSAIGSIPIRVKRV